MITFNHKGSFKNIEVLFKRSKSLDAKYESIFAKYGKEGVLALQSNTPIDTGKTSDSWSYRITRSKSGMTIGWYNSNNTVNGTPIAILLQYGHGTRSGAFISGTDYINTALKPVFDKLRDDIWKEVSRL